MMSRIVSHSGRRLLTSVLRLESASPRSFSSSGEDQHRLFRQQMEQLQEEREELFGFTDEEHAAWGKASGHQHEASFLERIEEARNRAPTDDDEGEDLPSGLGVPVDNSGPSMEFTHLSKDQKSVHMVDVGAKIVSQRKAVAQSKVIFPPDIVQAFSPDWKSKKGPIFDTAILAGIMAAKKTSDLIPLCHPLPLDQANVTIEMEDDRTAVIRCECRVTHKTGVEMEALTGASIAALTIYDMVKALSHDVTIEGTRLIHKSGGKRHVDKE